MKPTPELDRIFPLSIGSSERARLRPPPLRATAQELPGSVMTDHTYMWAWIGSRAGLSGVSFPPPTFGQLRSDPLSALNESREDAEPSSDS